MSSIQFFSRRSSKNNSRRGQIVNMPWLAGLFAVALALVAVGRGATAAKSSAHRKAAAEDVDRPTAAIDALREAGGTMTPAVRAAYAEWAKDQVVGEINASDSSIPADVHQELSQDATLADAMFASVYPPDASILRNYISLREKLGSDFVRKYHSLVIAAAVGRRTAGVTKRDLADDAPPDPEDLEAGTPVPEPESTLEVKSAGPLVSAVADFMKSTHSSALEIFEQPAKQQALIQFAKDQKVDEKEVARLEKPKSLGAALKNAMIVLGQRPAKRTARPDLPTWLTYLAQVYESNPRLPTGKEKGPHHWPLFPMDRAPWPLLMPLSRPLPLDEARYIYEKLEGLHGANRYHTYGPYRGWEGQLKGELRPSTWHWGAWPDRIEHGGVCVVMSGIEIDTHRALCEPSVPAGQPHHSNLISFHYEDGMWLATIDQAFAGGPAQTHALWMFKDVREGEARLVAKGDAGAEYHLGLGAAMNVGVRPYIDSRIAVHLYRALPDAEKSTIGAELLTQMTKSIGLNPEPWYLLAKQTTSAMDGLALAKRVISHLPAAALEHAEKEKKKAKKKAAKANPADAAENKYWETVAKFVVKTAVTRHGAPADPKDAQAVTEFLRQVGMSPQE